MFSLEWLFKFFLLKSFELFFFVVLFFFGSMFFDFLKNGKGKYRDMIGNQAMLMGTFTVKKKN